MTYIIQDWAGNTLFDGQEFNTFDEGDNFLMEKLDEMGLDDSEERGEYYIVENDQ